MESWKGSVDEGILLTEFTNWCLSYGWYPRPYDWLEESDVAVHREEIAEQIWAYINCPEEMDQDEVIGGLAALEKKEADKIAKEQDAYR
jgi:hypothetical protein